MKIVSHRKIIEFYLLYPESKTALESWYHIVRNAEWKNYADIKKDFNSVDGVGSQRYIFNIKGNEFRIVTVIQFIHGYVYVRFIGTHADYDKINSKNI